jgi:hypothetical protein
VAVIFITILFTIELQEFLLAQSSKVLWCKAIKADGAKHQVSMVQSNKKSMVRTVLEPTIKRLAPVGRIKSNSG